MRTIPERAAGAARGASRLNDEEIAANIERVLRGLVEEIAVDIEGAQKNLVNICGCPEAIRRRFLGPPSTQAEEVARKACHDPPSNIDLVKWTKDKEEELARRWKESEACAAYVASEIRTANEIRAEEDRVRSVGGVDLGRGQRKAHDSRERERGGSADRRDQGSPDGEGFPQVGDPVTKTKDRMAEIEATLAGLKSYSASERHNDLRWLLSLARAGAELAAQADRIIADDLEDGGKWTAFIEALAAFRALEGKP